MGTQPTKNNPKSHKFTKLKNWAHQIYQQIHLKVRFTNTLRALLITRRSPKKYSQEKPKTHLSHNPQIHPSYLLRSILKPSPLIKSLITSRRSKFHLHFFSLCHILLNQTFQLKHNP